MRQHRFFKDEHGFLLQKSRPWTDNPDDGRGDAVGRTVMAAITYGEKDFIDAFQSCFGVNGRGEWWGERHPDVDRDDLSRDHAIDWVIGLRYFNPKDLWMALRMPWRISEKFTQTIDMYLWIRAVAHMSKFWTFLYWMPAGVFLRVARWAIKLACRVGQFQTQSYKTFKATPKSELTKRQRWGRAIMEIFPSYSVHQACWQLSVLPDCWMKRRLQKHVRHMIEPTNYLCRLLLDGTLNDFEWCDALYFTGTDSFRWARRLDESTNIDLYPLEGSPGGIAQPKYNMESDMLGIIMNGKHKLYTS